MQYQGKKFFYTHSTFKPSDNYCSDEKTETRHFLMTKPYKEYLRDKKLVDDQIRKIIEEDMAERAENEIFRYRPQRLAVL